MGLSQYIKGIFTKIKKSRKEKTWWDIPNKDLMKEWGVNYLQLRIYKHLINRPIKLSRLATELGINLSINEKTDQRFLSNIEHLLNKGFVKRILINGLYQETSGCEYQEFYKRSSFLDYVYESIYPYK